MNIFRLAGDMTHLLSFLVRLGAGVPCRSRPAVRACSRTLRTRTQVLLLKIHATKSCAGALARVSVAGCPPALRESTPSRACCAPARTSHCRRRRV